MSVHIPGEPLPHAPEVRPWIRAHLEMKLVRHERPRLHDQEDPDLQQSTRYGRLAPIQDGRVPRLRDWQDTATARGYSRPRP